MAMAANLRRACYAILDLARGEREPPVKRILAAEAFSLAQRAQLASWSETGFPPPLSDPSRRGFGQ